MNRFSEIQETLKLNLQEVTGNLRLTSELLVDDLLLALGYNKKRNKNVHIPTDANRVWEIYDETKPRFIVCVRAYSENVEKIEQASREEIENAKKKGFHTILVTNGQIIHILSITKDGEESESIKFIKLYDIDNASDEEQLTPEDLEFVEALTYKNFDGDKLSVNVASMIHDALLGLLGDTGRILEVLNLEIPESLMDEAEKAVVEEISGFIGGTVKEEKSDENDEVASIDESELIAELNNTIEESSNTVKTLEEKLAEAHENIDELNKKIAESAETVDKLENTKTELLEKLEAAESEKETTNSVIDGHDEKEDNTSKNESYIQQIEELSTKISLMADELEESHRKIEKLTIKPVNTENEEMCRAHELLNSIEDNPEDERAYVAVVGEKLVVNKLLDKFVGLVLKELYNKVNFEVLPLLFDGDVFSIKEDKESSDLILGNKSYNINLDDVDEDDVLDKLSVIFSKFEKVVYTYKKIGTLQEENMDDIDGEDLDNDNSELVDGFGEEQSSYPEDEASEDCGESEELQLDEANDAALQFNDETARECVDVFHVGESEDTPFDENVPMDGVEEPVRQVDQSMVELELETDLLDPGDGEIGEAQNEEIVDTCDDQGIYVDDSVVNSETESEADEPTYDTEEVDVDYNEIAERKQEDFVVTSGAKCQALVSIEELGKVLWSREMRIGRPLYFNFRNEKMFVIRNNTLKEQVTDIINAILASAENVEEAIVKLRSLDLVDVSKFVEPDTSSNGIRIPYTKYKMKIDTLGKLKPILIAICEKIGVDTENSGLVFEAETSDALKPYIAKAIDKSDLRNPESEIEVMGLDNETDKIHCIISGTVLDSIILTKEQFQVQESLITACKAFRTSYCSEAIDDLDAVKSIIAEILSNSETPIDTVLAKLGNVIGAEKKFISTDKLEVSSANFVVEFNGDNLYVSDMDPWQLVYSLIKLHVLCGNNKSIGIRVELNKKLFEYMMGDIVFLNPVKEMAVKTFIKYACTRLK